MLTPKIFKQPHYHKPMRIPKRYGQSKEMGCPFCGKQATAKNEQGLEVCRFHTKSIVEEFKCVCGSWLEPKTGKFGRYFLCTNCGPINYNKAMSIKETSPIVKEEKPIIQEKIIKEITITTDDSQYFD